MELQKHSNRQHTATIEPRRVELDWLRVLVFGVLILYHIGMLYVANWGYHIKSSYLSSELESLMLLVNRWRLPLLFLISGVAIRHLLQKSSALSFLGKRSWRLLLPLLFGVLFIVPPQLYVEMTVNGDLDMPFAAFMVEFFDLDSPVFADYQSGILPHMDVNHLWYIRELWWFSIYLLCLTPILNDPLCKRAIDWLGHSNGLVLLAAPVLLFTLLGVLIFPLFNAGEGEGLRIAQGFTFVVIGYLLGWHKMLWQQIEQHRRLFLIVAIITYLILVSYYHWFWLGREEQLPFWGNLLETAFGYLNRWSWVLAILGYGCKYLKKTSPALAYLNQAVYPYYILHQTIIVVMAYWLSPLQLGGFVEAAIIIVATFTGCAVGFEVIRRVRPLRPLFGLKIDSEATTPAKATDNKQTQQQNKRATT